MPDQASPQGRGVGEQVANSVEWGGDLDRRTKLDSEGCLASKRWTKGHADRLAKKTVNTN